MPFGCGGDRKYLATCFFGGKAPAENGTMRFPRAHGKALATGYIQKDLSTRVHFCRVEEKQRMRW